MKKVLFILILMILFSFSYYAQSGGHQPPDKKTLAKIEQLEKAKIIEILNIDEEVSIRLFARRNEHKAKMKKYYEERDQVMKNIENAIKKNDGKDSFYREEIDKLISIEHKLGKERVSFLKSLTDILDSGQIAKYSYFEYKLRRELTASLMGK